MHGVQRLGRPVTESKREKREGERLGKHSAAAPVPPHPAPPPLPQGTHLPLTVHRNASGPIVLQGISNSASIVYPDIAVCEASPEKRCRPPCDALANCLCACCGALAPARASGSQAHGWSTQGPELRCMQRWDQGKGREKGTLLFPAPQALHKYYLTHAKHSS